MGGSRIVKIIIGRISDFVFAGLFFRGASYYWISYRNFTLFFFCKNIYFCNFFFIYRLFCVAVYSLSLYTSRITKDLLLEKITVFKIRFFLRNIIFLNI